jgi:hypothetical protein
LLPPDDRKAFIELKVAPDQLPGVVLLRCAADT